MVLFSGQIIGKDRNAIGKKVAISIGNGAEFGPACMADKALSTQKRLVSN